MREARARAEPAIRQFTIAIVIPAMQKGATIAPALPTLNFILMTAEVCMTGMETDMAVTALQHTTVEDTVILPVEEGAALRAIAFPAA